MRKEQSEWNLAAGSARQCISQSSRGRSISPAIREKKMSTLHATNRGALLVVLGLENYVVDRMILVGLSSKDYMYVTSSCGARRFGS